jgi:hypothetical protein
MFEMHVGAAQTGKLVLNSDPPPPPHPPLISDKWVRYLRSHYKFTTGRYLKALSSEMDPAEIRLIR